MHFAEYILGRFIRVSRECGMVESNIIYFVQCDLTIWVYKLYRGFLGVSTLNAS